jgi:ATP-dependent DNA helicase RecG
MTIPKLQQILSELLCLSSETEVIEFKEAKTTFDFTRLGKYFSALSNEANLLGKPNAWLVFGVSVNYHSFDCSHNRIKCVDNKQISNFITSTS